MSLPLEGARALDLAGRLPGGFCSLPLADFEAEAIKVADTGVNDDAVGVPSAATAS